MTLFLMKRKDPEIQRGALMANYENTIWNAQFTLITSKLNAGSKNILEPDVSIN